MRLLIERTIELLKLQIKENLRLINKNQAKIVEMLKKPVSDEQKLVFEQCYTANKKMLIENNDFINLQLTLSNFLEKHKLSDETLDEIPEELPGLPDDENIIFDMTVSEELQFDNLHPCFDDDEFFNRLIEYYTAVEAYEKCSELYKLRNLNLSAR
ncbi:MAG: hypothetical protein JXB19_05700 [Bacteroidales bacterium]|nr:hypothetical protein [Bacteroidales bacterium]